MTRTVLNRLTVDLNTFGPRTVELVHQCAWMPAAFSNSLLNMLPVVVWGGRFLELVAR